MVGYALILFAIAFESLAPFARKRADDALVASVVGGVGSVQHEELLAVAHALSVGHRECRLRYREVIDRIEHVCFARAVAAHKAVDTRRERECLLGDILEIEYGKFV